MHGAAAALAFGKNGMTNRSRPYVPILSSTPASTTEPPVGAWVWASGSQVWSGKSGTLIANASPKTANSHHCAPSGTPKLTSLYQSVVNTPLLTASPAAKPSHSTPTSISSEPTRV